MKTITITNQKGGIGKSTTAHAMGAYLAAFKAASVLLIDMDPQCNLTIVTGARSQSFTSYELLSGRASASECLYRISEGFDIIPGSNMLSRLALELTDTGKEYRLKEAMAELLDKYDYCIIDTPPALGVLTINALTVADHLIIPAQADLFSLEAIKELAGTIGVVRKYTNPSLRISGVLLTRYQPRTILTQELTDLIGETAKELETDVYKTSIREAIAVKEAQALHKDLFSYAPNSKVAADYRSFCEEFLAKEEKHGN